MSTISFAKAINKLLSTDNIKSVVSNKVYPLVASLNTTFPYIVFQRTSTPYSSKDNVYQDSINIEIIAVSDNYDKSVELAELIRNELEGKRNITVEEFRIASIKLVDTSESYSNDAYLQSLTFNFRINL